MRSVDPRGQTTRGTLGPGRGLPRDSQRETGAIITVRRAGSRGLTAPRCSCAAKPCVGALAPCADQSGTAFSAK
jgi:hypothetical protein